MKVINLWPSISVADTDFSAANGCSGTGNLAGLTDLDGVLIIGDVDNPARKGLVSISGEGLSSPDLVTALRSRGIRPHRRKADHYSGNILDPLGLPDAVRVSMCHCNNLDEVKAFLSAMRDILENSARVAGCFIDAPPSRRSMITTSL